MEEIKVGDKFKGKINGEIFEVTKIDEKENTIYYKCKEKIKELEAVNKRLRYTMNNAYLLDYIPRKQMEDKIEELENENKELKNKGTFIISDNKYEATDKEGFNDMINCRIREKIIIVLQELLKDGGE